MREIFLPPPVLILGACHRKRALTVFGRKRLLKKYIPIKMGIAKSPHNAHGNANVIAVSFI
jgi:hypothetical protein